MSDILKSSSVSFRPDGTGSSGGLKGGGCVGGFVVLQRPLRCQTETHLHRHTHSHTSLEKKKKAITLAYITHLPFHKLSHILGATASGGGRDDRGSLKISMFTQCLH